MFAYKKTTVKETMRIIELNWMAYMTNDSLNRIGQTEVLKLVWLAETKKETKDLKEITTKQNKR